MTHTEHDALKFAVLATDIVIFTFHDDQLLVRLTRVERPPHFAHASGFPGGLIKPTESAETAACRLTFEKAGIDHTKLHIEQLATFSRVDRDPRGRVVAVAYSAYVPWTQLNDIERSNTDTAWWAPVFTARHLAYDHDEVLRVAQERLRTRGRYTTLVSRLMPKEFTLTELENVYECILGTELDKRNFRKKILKIGVLKETMRMRSGGRFRPAKLYRFSAKDVKEIDVL